ncbi:uncharacterized protein LOC116189529 [Punica granatum]|uniref:Uncharacterized protein LOC116189529 n=1 Tax=Punica granatum TaxID=22663 RepID=A0A218XQV1_PUNGR|nr:uncharacterized protein LOC116189529 [Punica granatum]OWM86642.1 hypothetical protein CDL15_Pgr015677 [Punica granatum]
MATANGTGTGGRDARRRRIVDRGSDRLALITGRIQTLPSPPPTSPPDAPPPDQPHLPGGSHHREDKLAETLLPKLESAFDTPEASLLKHDSSSGYPIEDTSEAPAFEGQTGTDTSGLPNVEVGPKSETPSASLSASAPSSGNVHPSNLPANLLKFINPGQISSAIATSTSTRLLCSVIWGLLVVLSSIGFPILGSWIIRSMLTFRPLYLLLLTNVTIVAACIMSHKQPGHDRPTREENRNPSNDESGWVNHVGTSLELGFLLMKVLDAIVMDCSLYAVVVVSGLSFFGKFL